MLGLAVVLGGVLARAGALTWLGRLPGDRRREQDGLTVHVPLTTDNHHMLGLLSTTTISCWEYAVNI